MIDQPERFAGRLALVTGGTDGIGMEVARGLALRGIRVVIVGRDVEKGTRAEGALRTSTGNPDVEYVSADLSLMREANRLADELASRSSELHYLVHSAGIVRGRRTLTGEAIESNFAVNYLSRFALTERLLPILKAAGAPGAPARILIVGGGVRGGTIHYRDVNLTNEFSTLGAVSQFQTANDLFTLEQARRLASDGNCAGVSINCLKLGPVKTNIRREFPTWMKWLVRFVLDPLIAQTPEEAAEPALRLLLDEEYEGVTGALFSKVMKFKRLDLNDRERDLEQGRTLWQHSERLLARALATGAALADSSTRFAGS